MRNYIHVKRTHFIRDIEKHCDFYFDLNSLVAYDDNIYRSGYKNLHILGIDDIVCVSDIQFNSIFRDEKINEILK